MNYQKNAIDFATKYGIKLQVIGEPEYKRYFSNDEEHRFVFKLRLTRNKLSYTFNFGQSIAEGTNEPDMYSVLSCLTKYDPETFEDFCGSYGYAEDSRTAEKTYKAVCKEYKAVERLFGNIIAELAEIS